MFHVLLHVGYGNSHRSAQVGCLSPINHLILVTYPKNAQVFYKSWSGNSWISCLFLPDFRNLPSWISRKPCIFGVKWLEFWNLHPSTIWPLHPVPPHSDSWETLRFQTVLYQTTTPTLLKTEHIWQRIDLFAANVLFCQLNSLMMFIVMEQNSACFCSSVPSRTIRELQISTQIMQLLESGLFIWLVLPVPHINELSDKLPSIRLNSINLLV